MQTKSDFRTSAREFRKSQTEQQVVEKSNKIIEYFLNNYAFDSVCIYSSIGAEVQTNTLIERLISMGKSVYLPRCVGDDIEIHKTLSLAHCAKSAFGVLEPTWGESEAEVDIIVIPGLCFDKNGARIGYGKGYYDKLLKKLKGKRVAFSYAEMVFDEIPNNKNDQKADAIITQRGEWVVGKHEQN